MEQQGRYRRGFLKNLLIAVHVTQNKQTKNKTVSRYSLIFWTGFSSCILKKKQRKKQVVAFTKVLVMVMVFPDNNKVVNVSKPMYCSLARNLPSCGYFCTMTEKHFPHRDNFKQWNKMLLESYT